MAPGSSRKPSGGSMARWIVSRQWPASAPKAEGIRGGNDGIRLTFFLGYHGIFQQDLMVDMFIPTLLPIPLQELIMGV